MFDGLDELFDIGDRDRVARMIATFSATYPRIRVIVTSRIIGYRRTVLDGAGFGLHTLQDLTYRDGQGDPNGEDHSKDHSEGDGEGQVQQFVRAWYRIAYHGDHTQADRRTRQLLTGLDRSPSARDLAGNPLLLTILAVMGRRRELSKERHRVYQHAVEVLVQHWDAARAVHDTRAQGFVPPQVDEEDKREMLRRVARRMQDGRDGIAGNHIHRDDLLTEFGAYLSERYLLSPGQADGAAKAMLEQFRDRNFILARFGPELYGFVHRALLEYCCADEITHRLKETQELTPTRLASEVFGAHATDPAWQDVLLLTAGMIHDKHLAVVIDHLLNQATTPAARLRDDQIGRHWLLALRCLVDARTPSTLAAQAGRVVAGLIDLLTTATQHREHRLYKRAGFDVVENAQPVLDEFTFPAPARDQYGVQPRRA
jgi:predicted NACHT family NTPase